MNVLSLFDGISCGRLALERCKIKVDNYYASEIEKQSIQVAQNNFPSTKQLGDITKIQITDLPKIDLCIGGSPCQSFSRSGDGSGFDGKSKLFFEYLRILKGIQKINPDLKFLLENVVMKKEWESVITEYLGVRPKLIDSKLVSAQKRQRLYWTNIPFNIPEDKNIDIRNILEYKSKEPIDVGSLMWYENGEFKVRNATKQGYITVNNYDVINLDFPNSKTRRGRVSKYKSNTLNTGCNQGVFIDGKIYKLTVTECERLQTLPDNYTAGISESKRRNQIGNGWTVDVIAHIFEGLSD